jgi:Tol biopolymer transport system component
MLTTLLCVAAFAAQATQSPANHGARPAVSPDGTRILFISDRDGHDELYVINADGTGEHRVTNAPAAKGGPAWSADGMRVRYTSGTGDTSVVTEVDLDGAHPRELARVNGRAATLSPDGTHVIAMRGPWTEVTLFRAALDGSNETLLNDGKSVAWNSQWSPDGTLIAFTTRPATGQLQVSVMNADGTDRRQLTDVPPEEGRAQMPAWSPDGKMIAFQVNGSGGIAHLWVIDVATRKTTKLLSHTNAALDETPAWFADGRRLAFQSNRSGRMEIWMVNADGTGLRQVTGAASRPVPGRSTCAATAAGRTPRTSTAQAK